jgi:hypothetical protein
MKTLDEYLTEQFKKGVIFHSVTANVSKDGLTSFKIHALHWVSEEVEFAVIANSLVAKEHIGGE